MSPADLETLECVCSLVAHLQPFASVRSYKRTAASMCAHRIIIHRSYRSTAIAVVCSSNPPAHRLVVTPLCAEQRASPSDLHRPILNPTLTRNRCPDFRLPTNRPGIICDSNKIPLLSSLINAASTGRFDWLMRSAAFSSALRWAR